MSDTSGTRGQALTLDAVTAALLLVASLLFALSITVVTPLTTSTSSQHVENQQQARAIGTLESADNQNTLKPTVLYWNDSKGAFHGKDTGEVYEDPPPTDFGDTVRQAFVEKSLAANINIRYLSRDAQGDLVQRKVRLLRMGRPTANAVTGRETVSVFDTEYLREEDGSKSSTTVKDADTFYMPDIAPNSELYNSVTVEVVVWRL